MKRVLIVEDDASLVVGLSSALRIEGYDVLIANTGPEGLRLATEQTPDLILLDLMLPGMSGFEICKRIRDQQLRSKVIMLTCRSDENDRVFGLELGADDYVTKPFSLRELLARLRAQLRSDEERPTSRDDGTAQFRFGDVVVDLRRHELYRAGEPQPLTHREFRLLEYLIRHPGEVLTRDRLLEEAWGHEMQPMTRTVDNHILRLRKHVEPDPERPRYIKTVRGAGYLFDPHWTPEGES